MDPITDAWFVVVIAVAGWLNRERDKALEYLLAAKAKELGRKALRRLDTLVTPDTLLRWAPSAHRQEVRRQRETRPWSPTHHARN